MSDDPRRPPHPVGLHAEWYAHCARGELRFQRCTGCGGWRHPPRHRCAACGSGAWEWTAASGRGEVFSWTVTHQPLHPAFAEAVPYVIVVVTMEEGVRLVAGVRGIGPADLVLGLPVQAEVDPVDAEIGLVAFVPRTAFHQEV